VRLRVYTALLLLLSACAATAPGPKETVARNPRLANLRRAAALPWKDKGRCVVQEAFNPWSVMVERCFHALDREKVLFKDPTGKCAVASAGAAAVGIGICVLAAPEIVVGAVVITGTVVVAIAIKEALDAYEFRGVRPENEGSVLQTETSPPVSLSKRRPKPEPSGQNWPPTQPPLPERERSPKCTPQRVRHLGGDGLHNTCADKVPLNSFSGWDVLVNGKHFDALQMHARVLWEIKTDNFDTYSIYLQRTVPEQQVPELRRERDLARACGFDFRAGVRNAAHKAALELADPDLDGVIVVMDRC
jgi:hypothetical protein